MGILSVELVAQTKVNTCETATNYRFPKNLHSTISFSPTWLSTSLGYIFDLNGPSKTVMRTYLVQPFANVTS